MGEIRPNPRASGRAANRMAHHASVRKEDLLTMLRLRIVWNDGRLDLHGHPVIEIGLRFGDHIERHMRMLQSAIFGTLSTPETRLVYLHQDIRVVARHQITLALDVGRPEAVDDIARSAVYSDG